MDGSEDRPRVFAVAAVLDADGLEEFARRVGAELEEDQLRGDARDVAAHRQIDVAGVDLLHVRVEVDGQRAVGLQAEDFLG